MGQSTSEPESVETTETSGVPLLAVYAGSVYDFIRIVNQDDLLKSAIAKFRLPQGKRIKITKLGVEGDEQGAPNHGGIDRAIMHYAAENYERLKKMFPEKPPNTFVPSRFGENFSTYGNFNETNVCVGDIYKIGTVLLEVSMPRRPCKKLNHQFQLENMARTAQEGAMCGWFYRVKQEGEVYEGAKFELVERPFPNLTLEYCWRAYKEDFTKEQLQELVDHPVLSDDFKVDMKVRLQTGVLSTCSARLDGGIWKWSPEEKDKFVYGKPVIPEAAECGGDVQMKPEEEKPVPCDIEEKSRKTAHEGDSKDEPPTKKHKIEDNKKDDCAINVQVTVASACN